ncbi:hypothetical protein ARMGADRAFT_1093028 [Armillaria gallica]|uniref:Uncharacterized protein n=1 Tax=Armillaria gallica TaxID=47427 RepID=A0A2H3CW67_ARMGA|nr:hypothetical protein ARMGADRAFT_1093028 [Armillaria gallica]
MKSLPVDYASLVGVWCSTVLYGVNLVLYFSCVNLLIRRRWWILLGTATLQFIISTIHIAAGLRSIIEGFVLLKDPNGSILYWEDNSRLVNVLQETATITNCIACDTIMLWRLYVIWNKSVRMSVPPAAMVLAFGVCGYISIYHLSSMDPRQESMQNIYRWLQASYSLSLATQLSVTTMIVARIWWLSQRAGAWKSGPTSKPSMGIIWMIVESGAISAITSTLFLAFFNTDAKISIILADSLGQISAIAPSLILFRVALDTEVRKSVYEPSYNLHTRRMLRVTVEHSVVAAGMSSCQETCAAPYPDGRRGILELSPTHLQRLEVSFIHFPSPLAAMLFLLFSLSFTLWTLCVSALKVSAPDHALKNQNVTVNLTYSPSDPPSFFLAKLHIDGSPQVSRNVTNISGFTANTAVNITFHDTGTFRVLASNISDTKDLNVSSASYFLAESQSVQVQGPESPDDKQHDGHNRHGNEDDNHGGNGSGRSGSTQTVNAVPLVSPVSSNTSFRPPFDPGLIQHVGWKMLPYKSTFVTIEDRPHNSYLVLFFCFPQVGMSFGPFHVISFLSLASISFALQIQIPDEKHIFQGQNTTVTLIHGENDPTDVLLKEIRLKHNSSSNDALHIINFTAPDAQVNITFNHPDKYQIFAYGNTSDPIAHSSVFEVHDNSKGDHSHHGSDKGLIVGAVLGSVALIVIALLTVSLIFFRSRRRRSFQDQAIHHSPIVPTPFLKYLAAKCNPCRKPVRLDDNDLEPSVSRSIAQRESIQTLAEECMPHESTVLPSQPRAMNNGSAGQIQRLRAQIQQLILDRESARPPGNEQDPPPAYVEGTENVLRVEIETSAPS